MKVSIIVPVYNCEDYLDQCIQSLLKQTLDEIEIIMVNDGSTDHSLAIIEKYAKENPTKLKYFDKCNGGQASARNMALPHATGEYLGFVDSDDWVAEDMYEKMYNEAKRGDYDVVVCDMVDVYPDHEVYHSFSDFTNKFRQTPSACNKIFKRSIVGNTNFPLGLWYEDFQFTTFILFKTDSIGRVGEGLYRCHCRPVSTMSNDNSEKNLDMIQVVGNIIQHAKDTGVYEKYKNDLKYMVIDHILITTINRVAVQNNPKKHEVIRKLIAFSLQCFPDLLTSDVMKEESENRQRIAKLNGKGHYRIAQMLLKVNHWIKGKHSR